MAMYVYSTAGEPIGFVYETAIYDLQGNPVGRILGSRVHRFDGSYVGEWYKQNVVSRPDARPRTLPPTFPPPARQSPGTSFRRRAVVDYGHPDVFHLLALTPSNDDHPLAVREAAE